MYPPPKSACRDPKERNGPVERKKSACHGNASDSDVEAPTTNKISEHSFRYCQKEGGALRQTLLTFPEKLMNILDSEMCSNAIHWTPTGEAFCIRPKSFIPEVLNVYFQGTKLESFKKKLLRYGFQRLDDFSFLDSSLTYCHGSFQRNQPELLVNIRSIKTSISKFKSSELGLQKNCFSLPTVPVGAVATDSPLYSANTIYANYHVKAERLSFRTQVASKTCPHPEDQNKSIAVLSMEKALCERRDSVDFAALASDDRRPGMYKPNLPQGSNASMLKRLPSPVLAHSSVSPMQYRLPVYEQGCINYPVSSLPGSRRSQCSVAMVNDGMGNFARSRFALLSLQQQYDISHICTGTADIILLL